ncbi:MAG TPA: AraC family transcriptional regulator [Terriglobales bacterium]|jgi:AraC family transcriptional regulator|nr:AraC family transcriptional regulator [Terriglobales bacterium]
MNRYTPFLETPALTIGRFDHPEQNEHHDPDGEVSREYSINFVERGEFSIGTYDGDWRLHPGQIFLSYPGMQYECRHDEFIPRDRCLSVCYVKEDVGPEFQQFELAARRSPVIEVSNRTGFLRWALARVDDAIAAEELGAELLVEVQNCDNIHQRPFRECQFDWYAERVDAVREKILRTFHQNHSLSSLARGVGMSTFHFARVFRQLTGSPPHQYLREVRLKEAARRLCDGVSVTETCFSCGFQNLSHFTRSFQRRFGTPPSKYIV